MKIMCEKEERKKKREKREEERRKKKYRAYIAGMATRPNRPSSTYGTEYSILLSSINSSGPCRRKGPTIGRLVAGVPIEG